MTAEMISDIVGYAASICMIFGYLPQAIYTIKTRETDAIALPTFLLMGLGSLFFTIQGALLDNYPLMLTNIVTLVASSIV